MNAPLTAIRAGLQRGAIEFRQTITNPGEVLGWVFFPGVALLVMYLLRDRPCPAPTSRSVPRPSPASSA